MTVQDIVILLQLQNLRCTILHNSSHLPVSYTDQYQKHFKSKIDYVLYIRTVFHAFLGQTSKLASRILVRRIAENFKLPYFTLSPTYSIVQNTDILQEKNQNAKV